VGDRHNTDDLQVRQVIQLMDNSCTQFEPQQITQLVTPACFVSQRQLRCTARL